MGGDLIKVSKTPKPNSEYRGMFKQLQAGGPCLQSITTFRCRNSTTASKVDNQQSDRQDRSQGDGTSCPEFLSCRHQTKNGQRDQCAAGMRQVRGPKKHARGHNYKERVHDDSPVAPYDEDERNRNQKHLREIVGIIEKAHTAESENLLRHLIVGGISKIHYEGFAEKTAVVSA